MPLVGLICCIIWIILASSKDDLDARGIRLIDIILLPKYLFLSWLEDRNK